MRNKAQNQVVPCPKCNGEKYISGCSHVENGVCFMCKGNGTILVSPSRAKELGPSEYQIKRAEWILGATDEQFAKLSYGQLLKARQFCHFRVPGYPQLHDAWLANGERFFQEAQERRRVDLDRYALGEL